MKTKKRALITGINGQDGSYLAELLLAKGYEVHGLVRREAFEAPALRLCNILSILERVNLHVGSLDNHILIYKLLADVQPDECYHLAAASFVSYNFDDESSVLSANFNSTHHLLSSIKELVPTCRFYFAGSSEMFGDVKQRPQNESTRFNPRAIYGISKVAGYYLSENYRRQHEIFTCNGILYNHESPRRGLEFVTRKISSHVAKIHLGLAHEISLGNIDAKRDWGYAPEYVNAMWAMLNQDHPDDYVIATGKLHSVRELLEAAFNMINKNYQDYVKLNPLYHRPHEVVALCGDASKAKKMLGFEPQKTIFSIMQEMVDSDIQLLKQHI